MKGNFSFLLLMIMLLSAVSSDAQWEQYSAKWEGKPGSMLVNMELKDISDRTKLPYLVSIGWKFDNCGTVGLPDTLTHQSVSAVSDKLAAYLDIQSTCSLAGTFIHDCHWYDYYYIRDTLALGEFIKDFFERNRSPYTPLISMVRDTGWAFYERHIYPDAYLIEYMHNERAIARAKRAGAKSKERLSHWAYFADPESRDRYRIIVLERGFSQEGSGRVVGGGDMPFYYHFSRRDALDVEGLTELTFNLTREAKKLGGVYEGWEIR